MIRKISLVAAMLLLVVTAATAQKVHRSKVQRVTVTLSEGDGYKPDSFTLRQGITAKITFVRHGAACGEILVIPEYGIRSRLPINKPVTITFVPRHTGSFKFACGMDMYKGQIVVT